MNRLGPEFIELFIENGAFVNSRDENTPLAVFCRSKSTPRFDSIKTLIDYGGSIRSEDNKKTPLDALTDKEVMKEINEYYSIVGEFEDLLIRKELTDFVFECSDESIECHKDILRMRLGNEIFMNLNKDIFKNYTSNETQIFLRFVYCGVIQTFQDLDLLEKISKEIGLANFKEKIGKKSLLHDLNELYKDEKSKDFRIKCKNGQELKIHKIVLATRSNLFRSMFIMVKESSDSVSDYSERSIQSLNILFYWLYHDKFPDEIEVSEELYQEFLEFEDFYQLEKTSNFNSILESKKK
ncbi:speckle-type poz protein [Anaeramoeba ignava]|uniref:Speckle-type poz protein n=1 Tax=Anaeramoeba ignava TaxID=1746090 RepID=A0A9Q0R5D2_ANAIG|nr:speckle-type poz protein [Anaeramoeba ignava]